jgi:Cys-tRNA(Pro) deacylase
MAAKSSAPAPRPTPATRYLDARGASYQSHSYAYIDRGGARQAAVCLQVDEAAVVKTLVMRADTGERLLVLMHGDREVSQKNLARLAGVRRVDACSPDEALRETGYQVGGISPFGTRNTLRVYAEATLLELPRLFINAGRRGLLLEIEPGVLGATLELSFASIAAAKPRA